jgi:hypothetical protein
VKGYRSESLLLSRAAQLAQIPLVDFMQHVSRLGVPVVRGDAQTLRDDIEDLDAWLERKRERATFSPGSRSRRRSPLIALSIVQGFDWLHTLLGKITTTSVVLQEAASVRGGAANRKPCRRYPGVVSRWSSTNTRNRRSTIWMRVRRAFFVSQCTLAGIA